MVSGNGFVISQRFGLVSGSSLGLGGIDVVSAWSRTVYGGLSIVSDCGVLFLVGFHAHDLAICLWQSAKPFRNRGFGSLEGFLRFFKHFVAAREVERRI